MERKLLSTNVRFLYMIKKIKKKKKMIEIRGSSQWHKVEYQKREVCTGKSGDGVQMGGTVGSTEEPLTEKQLGSEVWERKNISGVPMSQSCHSHVYSHISTLSARNKLIKRRDNSSLNIKLFSLDQGGRWEGM